MSITIGTEYSLSAEQTRYSAPDGLLRKAITTADLEDMMKRVGIRNSKEFFPEGSLCSDNAPIRLLPSEVGLRGQALKKFGHIAEKE